MGYSIKKTGGDEENLSDPLGQNWIFFQPPGQKRVFSLPPLTQNRMFSPPSDMFLSQV